MSLRLTGFLAGFLFVVGIVLNNNSEQIASNVKDSDEDHEFLSSVVESVPDTFRSDLYTSRVKKKHSLAIDTTSKKSLAASSFTTASPSVKPVISFAANSWNQGASGKKSRFIPGYKNAHIQLLEEQTKIESLTWQDKISRRQVRAYLVEDVFNPSRFLVVKRISSNQSGIPEKTYVQIANELIISLHEKLSDFEIKKLAAKHKLNLKQDFSSTNALHVSFDKISIETLREYESVLKKDPLVKSVSANAMLYASGVPNDSSYDQMWALKQTPSGFDIDSELAWDKLKDCSTTPVAVLDTGVDPNHPDLKVNLLIAEGRNFTGNDATDVNDGNGHGTHVSGTIGAVGNNGLGVVGVCWKALVIPIKVLNDQGAGTSAQVISGISYAAEQSSAKILNLSLGGAPPSQAEFDAIELVRANGKLFVAAAGNNNGNNDIDPQYPASYENAAIISVAAYTEQGDIAEFSNFGQNSVDIAAPGQDILSTIPTSLSNNPYTLFSGTSMAAPHIAGALALFWSFVPDQSAQQVKTALLETARVGSFSKQIVGSRMLDLGALIDLVSVNIDFQLTGDEPLTSSNSSSLVVPVSFSEPVDAILKVELVTENGVIQGSFDRAKSQIIFTIPFGYSTLRGDLKVTEEGGRSYVIKAIDYPLDQQKYLDFSEIVTDEITGPIACRLQFVSTNVSLDAKLIYEAKLDSEDSCRTICNVIGPMAYSSFRKVECGTLEMLMYESI